MNTVKEGGTDQKSRLANEENLEREGQRGTVSAWDHEGRGQGHPLRGSPETPAITTIQLTHPAASDLRPAQ